MDPGTPGARPATAGARDEDTSTSRRDDAADDGAGGPRERPGWVVSHDSGRGAATDPSDGFGAPSARDDNIALSTLLQSAPSDRPTSSAASLDAPSIATRSLHMSAPPDDDELQFDQPIQEAQLADEQELEADVRHIPPPS